MNPVSFNHRGPELERFGGQEEPRKGGGQLGLGGLAGPPQWGSGSSLWVFLNSWGPDDDGKTVDGPHQLGKVTELHVVSETQDTLFVQVLELLQVAPFPTLPPLVVPDSWHPALPPPFGLVLLAWRRGSVGDASS